MELSDSDIKRFWSKVDKRGDDECWLWTGRLAYGYGNMNLGNPRKQYRAHRISYCLAHGSIPDGLYVLHCCPNGHTRACVNPEHLYAGTQRENNLDTVREGRWCQGSQHPNAKLTESDVLSILATLAEGKPQRTVAAAFGISQKHVYRIAHGLKWTHITRKEG